MGKIHTCAVTDIWSKNPPLVTAQAVCTILEKRTTQAGVERASPHDFRRTYVGDLLDAGADIVTVQKMAGHADPATTSRYDRRDSRARHKVPPLQVPFTTRRTLRRDNGAGE